jgi:hypothetical protein
MQGPQMTEDVFNASGMSARGHVCNVQADDGEVYVFKDIAEFVSHPSDPNSCALRPTSYSDGLVAEDLSNCNAGADIYDKDVVRSVQVQQVMGYDRCVIKLKPGLPWDAYQSYESKVRDTSVKLTQKYKDLVIANDKVRDDIIAAIARLAQLADLIKQHNEAYDLEIVAYNIKLAETRAVEQHIVALEQQVGEARQKLDESVAQEMTLKNAIQGEVEMTAAIRKKAAEEEEAYRKMLTDEKAARAAAKVAALEAQARADKHQRELEEAERRRRAAEAAAEAERLRLAAIVAMNARKECHVQFFEHPNFRGHDIKYMFRGTPGGRVPNVGFYEGKSTGWNDRFSSFKVFPLHGARCTLGVADGMNLEGTGMLFGNNPTNDKYYEFRNLEHSKPRMDDNITSVGMIIQ